MLSRGVGPHPRVWIQLLVALLKDAMDVPHILLVLLLRTTISSSIGFLGLVCYAKLICAGLSTGSTPNLSQSGNPRVSGTPRAASSSRHASQNDFPSNPSPAPAPSHESIPPNSSNPETQPSVPEALRRSYGGIAHPRRQSSPSLRQSARFPPEALQIPADSAPIPADSGEIATEQGQRAKLPRTSLMGRRIPGLTVELSESSASEPSPNSDGGAGLNTPEDVAGSGGLKEGKPPEVGASSNGSLSGVRFEQGAGMPRQRSPPRREKSRLSKVNRSVSESDFVPESSTQGRRVFSDPGSEKTAGPRSEYSQGAMLEPVSGGAKTASEKGAEAAGDYDPQEREAGLGPRRLEVSGIEGNETKHSPVEDSRPRSRAGGDVTLQGGRISRRGSLGALGGATGLSRRGSVSPLEEHEGRIWLEIRVTDSGIGLTKEQQGKLFSAFIQADCTTTRRFGGTGLGLAICKRLVNAMGGDIWVTSEMGAGSTFAFTVGLRVAEDPVGVLAREGKTAGARSTTPPMERVTKSSKQCKILVAEDNPINQLLIRKMLKHYGHETHIVGNGQLAVDEIKNKPFHYSLILMDLQMPVLDGLGATKAIRALGPPGELPIFALTADVLVGAGFELEENGLDGYLTKPINWETLSSVIENASYQGGPTEEQAA
jgi:CheY-like chemotaxis protein